MKKHSWIYMNQWIDVCSNLLRDWNHTNKDAMITISCKERNKDQSLMRPYTDICTDVRLIDRLFTISYCPNCLPMII